MKTFTRIGLPVLVVAGLVFGITFVRLYSPEDPQPDKPTAPSSGGGKKGPDLPLKFALLTAKAPKDDSTEQFRFLTYWDPANEVGAPGHFEFWCQNAKELPVRALVDDTNCTCAGVDLAVVPPDALGDYQVGSAVAAGPLCPAPGLAAALVHVAFDRRLAWGPMFRTKSETEKEMTEQMIPPAASAAAPQVALVRLTWTGKGQSGPKGITASIVAQAGDGPWSKTLISAETMVVPAFQVLRQDGPGRWTDVQTLDVGEVRPNGEARQTLYLASVTRPYLLYSASLDKPDPCITWTDPVPATDEERAGLAGLKDTPFRRLRSLYKFDLIIRERAEVPEGGKNVLRQLDLGVMDKRLTVAAADAGTWPVALKGRVLGDVTVQGGAEKGRIDLGNSFPADQDRVRDVTLLADRPGLDLTLLDKETVPNYLKAELKTVSTLPDGRKQWRLRVVVPARLLYGALPEGSVVVLQTNGPTGRKLRIPVRGMTYDTGGPRL